LRNKWLYDPRVPLDQREAPKYRRIFDKLKLAITSGEYRSGQRLPSESELVKEFGTSRLTVNRALRELQMIGLIDRKVGSGSYVSVTKSPGYTFGLLIPELGRTEIFEPICRGMAETPLADQHVLLWGRSPADSSAMETQARESCEQWIAKKVSGVFFAPLELTSEKDAVNQRIADLFQQANIPVVLIDRDLVPYPERSRHDLIGIDNRRACYVLTEHLLHQGCKRLAFVGRHRSAPSCTARGVGFREAIQDAGLEFKPASVRHHTDPSNPQEVRGILSELKPDGFVCSNDFTAAQLMRTLDGLSVSVPDDVLMGGFDDVKYASLLSVPLTTIHQPCADIGAAAVRVMVERLQNPDLPPRDVLLNFRLVVRESSQPRSSTPVTIRTPRARTDHGDLEVVASTKRSGNSSRAGGGSRGLA
jgi:DNA-binding LacI/PurR family transcriptional regulator